MRTIQANVEFDKEPAYYFNSASLGICPKEVPDDYNAKKDENEEFDWDEAVEVVQQEFGKLLGQPSNTISVFHNTTAGVQRILLRLSQLLGPSNATLLLTDLEYPGIVSAVDETWTGRVIMAQVADLVWKDKPEKITKNLMDSILMARPSVVYLSHVARSTGYRISESIIDFIRRNMPRTVIIIDGAQACGNIHVDETLVTNIDFYVTSGHKWLCGKQTLGLVYAHESWELKDPAQSYSMTRGSTGTGSQDVIRSLQKSLTHFNGESTGQIAKNRMKAVEKHNSSLADRFSGELRNRKLAKPVGGKPGTWRRNGIVTVAFDSHDIVMKLKKTNFKFTALVDESWRDKLGAAPPGRRYLVDPKDNDPFREVNFKEAYVPKIEGYLARFCFHYYHTVEHVNALLTSIEEIKQSFPRKAAKAAKKT